MFYPSPLNSGSTPSKQTHCMLCPLHIVDQVEEALEQLSTVGGVSVFREDVAGSLYGFEYAVTFEPWGGNDIEHFLNYGDMPAILVRSTPTKLQLSNWRFVAHDRSYYQAGKVVRSR